MSHAEDNEGSRRDFLYYATAGAGAVTAGAAVWPLVNQMNPSADVRAASTMRVDVAGLEPGSQLRVLFLGKPVFIRRRTEEEIAEARAVALPVKAGGVVVFDPMVPHASLENTTQGMRWSFDLRFNVTGQPTGRAHFPEFVARSKAAPGSVLTDWQELRQRWEAARAQLAEAAHIDIHRWRSDAPYCA